MKKSGCFLPVLIMFILFLGSSSGSSQQCLITPEEALEKAKEICKEYGILYDRALGPYLVLPHSSESEPKYLLYFAKDTMITANCWIDGRNDGCGRCIAPVAVLLLDSAEVKEQFKSEKGTEVIFIQLVRPIRLWAPSFMLHGVAWWIIDKKGNCYYVSLFGEIISFKKLAETRKRSEEDIRTGRLRIIEDSTLQENEK